MDGCIAIVCAMAGVIVGFCTFMFLALWWEKYLER